MRKFQVNVNGKTYVVEVEELTEGAAPTAAAASAAPAPQVEVKETPAGPKAEAQPPVPPQAQGVAEGHEVKAPLRGQIVQVLVKPGDQVKQGQVLLTIEALKLENELVAPIAGTVTGVFTQPGASVEAGAVLVTIKEN